MGFDYLRDGFLALVISTPVLFFVALGVLYAASLSGKYVELPNGVRYNPGAAAGLAAVAAIGGVVLTYVVWNLWRGYRSVLRDKLPAYGLVFFLIGYAAFFSFIPAATAGNIELTLAALITGVALIFLGYVLAFILAAYQLYKQTGESLFLAATILYALFFIGLVTAYIGHILMYLGAGRAAERRSTPAAPPPPS